MDKEQALHSFFSMFNVPAYDVSIVPDDAPLPRITYEVATDNFDHKTAETFSIWDRSTSWKSVTDILHEIERAIGYGGVTIPYTQGLLWITRGVPFANRLVDEDDTIRRIVVNLELEFISEV
jgi:hypothetical protein